MEQAHSVARRKSGLTIRFVCAVHGERLLAERNRWSKRATTDGRSERQRRLQWVYVLSCPCEAACSILFFCLCYPSSDNLRCDLEQVCKTARPYRYISPTLKQMNRRSLQVPSPGRNRVSTERIGTRSSTHCKRTSTSARKEKRRSPAIERLPFRVSSTLPTMVRRRSWKRMKCNTYCCKLDQLSDILGTGPSEPHPSGDNLMTLNDDATKDQQRARILGRSRGAPCAEPTAQIAALRCGKVARALVRRIPDSNVFAS